MDEFSLIDDVVLALGERAAGGWVAVGPGDDAAVIDVTGAHQAVSSIDTLVQDVHFPASIPPALLGFRALMVSLSDLAAMAATPRYVLVAMTLPAVDRSWVLDCARGMAEAAQVCDVYVCGGNFTRGPLSITVSVHGEIASGGAVLRSGARPGDGIYVSGELGAAAACVRLGEMDFSGTLNPLQQRYARPMARVDLIGELRAAATAAIDVSDGLLQDLGHLCAASGLQARLDSKRVPTAPGAQLVDALYGGDDYELLCAASVPMSGFTRIGSFGEGSGVFVDDEPAAAGGYQHFGH